MTKTVVLAQRTCRYCGESYRLNLNGIEQGCDACFLVRRVGAWKIASVFPLGPLREEMGDGVSISVHGESPSTYQLLLEFGDISKKQLEDAKQRVLQALEAVGGKAAAAKWMTAKAQ